MAMAFRCSLQSGKKKKSQGDKSGEYGASGNKVIECSD
jgi:hypothetical protein